VARHGDLETAAQRRAMQRRHHGFLERIERFTQIGGTHVGRRSVEFGDVGARDKRAPGTGQHHGTDVGGRTGFAQRGQQLATQGRGQRIDRRPVDLDEGDVAVALDADQAGHCFLPLS
jgi:hypothetical protein